MLLSRRNNFTPQYNQLLTVTLLRLLVIPFSARGWGELLASFLLFDISFLIIRSYQLRRSLFFLMVAIASTGFILEICLTLKLIPAAISVSVLIQSIYCFFFGSAVLLILRNVLQTSRVTSDTLKGGVCIYLLLGYSWALLYSIVYTLDPNAFSIALITDTSRLNTLYFSFITLTTLGFGDITPTSELSAVLTILEALVGQIYPAIFMAFLVSSYLAHKDEPPKSYDSEKSYSQSDA